MAQKSKPASVEAYIKALPDAHGKPFLLVCSDIESCLPNAETSISWGMPTYKVAGRTIIQLAAWQRHIGIYPGPKALEHFRDKIAAADLATSKGTLKVPYDDVPHELITRITTWCLENR